MFRFLGLIFSCVVLQLTAMQNLTLQFAQFFNNKDALEGVYNVSFCRFLGSFEPIFDSNCGGNINFRI